MQSRSAEITAVPIRLSGSCAALLPELATLLEVQSEYWTVARAANRSQSLIHRSAHSRRFGVDRFGELPDSRSDVSAG